MPSPVVAFRPVPARLIAALAAALALAAVPVPAGAATVVDKFFRVQPIIVCLDIGGFCAPAPLSQDFTREVYAQAAVLPVFLPERRLFNSALLEVETFEEIHLPGNGQSSDAQTINMWFVQRLISPSGGTRYGLARLGGNVAMINGTAVEDANRIDTVAHELAHNLGLDHDTFGAGGTRNLVTEGPSRIVPGRELTPNQIARLRNSQFVSEMPDVVVAVDRVGGLATETRFDVSFDPLVSGIALTRLSFDFGTLGATLDFTNAPVGVTFEPLLFREFGELSRSDIGLSGWFTGSSFAEISFAPGAFLGGGSVMFSGLFDLLTPSGDLLDDLSDLRVGMEFDIGSHLVSVLDAGFQARSRSIVDMLAFEGTPAPFCPQLAPGELGPFGLPTDPDIPPIPLPPSVLMLAAGLALLGVFRRRGAAVEAVPAG